MGSSTPLPGREYPRGIVGDKAEGYGDAELVDSIGYPVFPNFSPWGGPGVRQTYRWRPWGDHVDMRVMDGMLLAPFKGGAPVLEALAGGHIDTLMTDSNALPMIQSGKVRAIAVTAARRLSQLPDVPTLAELGYPGATTGIGFALFAPAGTPPAVVARIHAALKDLPDDPAIQSTYRNMNFVPMLGTPEQLQERLVDYTRRYWPVIRRLGLKPT